MSILNLIKGTLIGVAVGDALGAPHEFRNQKLDNYTGTLHIEPFYNFRFVKRRDVIGQYTDDTEMTLTLAKSLVRNKKYNRNDVILSYEKWALKSPLMGVNTRTLFKGIKTVRGFEKRWNKQHNNILEKEWSQSNGSMMRCAPLAFIFGNGPVIADCKLTNPSRINIDSNIIYVSAVRLAILGYPRITIFKHVSNLSTTKETKHVLETVLNKELRSVTGKTKGWVLHSLYCSMWSLLYSKNFQEGMDWVINLGGDTDTNAAISGAMLGAIFGYNKLNKEDITKKNIHILLNSDTTKGDIPRTQEYTIGPENNFTSLCNDLYKMSFNELGDKMLTER